MHTDQQKLSIVRLGGNCLILSGLLHIALMILFFTGPFSILADSWISALQNVAQNPINIIVGMYIFSFAMILNIPGAIALLYYKQADQEYHGLMLWAAVLFIFMSLLILLNSLSYLSNMNLFLNALSTMPDMQQTLELIFPLSQLDKWGFISAYISIFFHLFMGIVFWQRTGISHHKLLSILNFTITILAVTVVIMQNFGMAGIIASQGLIGIRVLFIVIFLLSIGLKMRKAGQ